MDKALIIFLLTYVIIAIGQPPLFRIYRAGAALIGASRMIITGVIDTRQYPLAAKSLACFLSLV
jgi:Na+/H+ antiporter NhaD/arsenite permease-like protein